MAPALGSTIESADCGYQATAIGRYCGWDWTWDLFRAELDAGRPLVLLVDTGGDGSTDHFVTATGYDDAGGARNYACLNTWDTGVHWFEFTGVAAAQPWGIYGGVTLTIKLTDQSIHPPLMVGHQ